LAQRCLGSGFFFKRDDAALSDPAACWRTIAFDLAQCNSVIAKKMIQNMKGRKEGRSKEG